MGASACLFSRSHRRIARAGLGLRPATRAVRKVHGMVQEHAYQGHLDNLHHSRRHLLAKAAMFRHGQTALALPIPLAPFFLASGTLTYRVCGSGVVAMVVRIKKIHPALKHAGYAATAVLPGEDPAAFEKLHQDLIAELRPDGPLENDTVATIAHLTWRKQNLGTIRIAERAREVIQSFPDAKTYRQHVKNQIRRQLGDTYQLFEIGDAATLDGLMKELATEERLDIMIDRCLKRLLFLRGLKSLSSAASSAPLPRIPGPQEAA
jgi:hypothetical protein